MSPYPLHNILFLDIETVSQFPAFTDLSEDWQELWRHKADAINREKGLLTAEELYDRAAIYAEFGKIVCISCGVLSGPPAERKLLIKSFFGDDEKDLLLRFWDLLHKWGSEGQKYLCAHNGKDFDFPYLCRRMVIHGMRLPSVLNLSGKKPWEIPHLDTMELWKFGEYKSYVSLNLLAHTLGIPTPKDDIDGSQVGAVYWVQRDLDRIVSYCQKDVFTVAQVYLRLHGETSIRPENMEIR